MTTNFLFTKINPSPKSKHPTKTNIYQECQFGSCRSKIKNKPYLKKKINI